MGMYFVSNKSQPRSNFGARPVTQLTEQSVAEPVAQSVTSIITRTRPRPNTSRFNMNDTFAARGRPCPRS